MRDLPIVAEETLHYLRIGVLTVASDATAIVRTRVIISEAYLKLVITVSRQLPIPQYPRGDCEFAIAAEGMKEESSVAVGHYRRQTHAKDPFLAPLKVQASNVVVTRQGVRHEVTVRQSPGYILPPRVDDQAVTELVGHVGERVVAATLAQIDRDVGDEGVLVRRCNGRVQTRSKT